MSVDQAFVLCEAITRARAGNFYYGIRLLAPDRRAALCAVYALARRIDDIGDGQAPRAAKLAALTQLRRSLAELDQPGSDPVFTAVAAVARRHADFEELIGYCRCVAGSVGRLCLAVFGSRPDPRAAEYADALGIALQQTNILRDIREDLGNGRVYLPQDDLMDGDTQRRHRPTVWALWGPASAILTGDALLVLAQEVLLDDASPHRGAAARLLAEATRQLVRGQVQDVAFESRDDVTVAECLDMVAGKTGALFSVSTAITGKPVYSDLRSGKKTLPVTYALTHGGPAGRELAAWLSAPDTAALRYAADLVEAAGGRAWAAAEAQRRVAAACHALTVVPILDDPRADLTAIAHFIVARES